MFNATCFDTDESSSGLLLNPLTPNENYSGRTAPLTSKVAFCIFIQQIYILNILNMVYTLRFFFLSLICSLFHNSNVFGSCIIHILYIYSTNICTEHFKHGIYSPVFSCLQNAVCFIILTYLVPVLFSAA